MYIKYKTMSKKMKLVAIQLTQGTKEHIKQATMEPRLEETRNIYYKFIKESLKKLENRKDDFLKEVLMHT